MSQDLPPRRRRRPAVLQHWIWLGICCGVVAAAFCLQVRGDDQQDVGSSIGFDFVLPTVCMTRRVLGINCPGCGLTRSFISLAHGDLQASWEFHRLGWLFALAVLLQIPYRIAQLVRPGKIRFPHRVANGLCIFLSVLLMANWILGIFL